MRVSRKEQSSLFPFVVIDIHHVVGFIDSFGALTATPYVQRKYGLASRSADLGGTQWREAQHQFEIDGFSDGGFHFSLRILNQYNQEVEERKKTNMLISVPARKAS